MVSIAIPARSQYLYVVMLRRGPDSAMITVEQDGMHINLTQTEYIYTVDPSSPDPMVSSHTHTVSEPSVAVRLLAHMVGMRCIYGFVVTDQEEHPDNIYKAYDERTVRERWTSKQ